MNTQASRARRQRRFLHDPAIPPRSKHPKPAPDPATHAQLPDPWLFDSEELINALDKIRETILRIPNATHEVHLRTLAAIDEVWRLREHLRELLALHRAMQRSFAQRASILQNATSRHVSKGSRSPEDGSEQNPAPRRCDQTHYHAKRRGERH